MDKLSMTGDNDLRLYREKRARKRFYARLFVVILCAVLTLLVTFILVRYYFVVEKIEIEGSERYTVEELLEASGIGVGNNILVLSEDKIEERMKAAFPYIRSVTLEKDYPNTVTLHILEEYTTFSYEMLGEYFLFNHELRLMDKFETFEELSEIRTPIVVKMPLPESCIVPQYIELTETASYIPTLIRTLSDTPLINEVTELDLADKFVIRMVLRDEITVEFGDYTMAQEKFLALYRLLGDLSEKKTGHVDLSDYPNCFYALTPKNDS